MKLKWKSLNFKDLSKIKHWLRDFNFERLLNSNISDNEVSILSFSEDILIKKIFNAYRFIGVISLRYYDFNLVIDALYINPKYVNKNYEEIILRDLTDNYILIVNKLVKKITVSIKSKDTKMLKIIKSINYKFDNLDPISEVYNYSYYI